MERHPDNQPATRGDMRQLEKHTDAQIDALRTHSDAQIDALRTHSDAQIGALRTHTDAQIGALRAHSDARIAAVEVRQDELRADFRAFTTGQRTSRAAIYASLAGGVVGAALAALLPLLA